MTTWSHSRLQTYEDCPRKFKFHYIDKIEPTKKSIYPFLGDMVHQVLEALYRELHFGTIPPLEKLLEDFDRLWDKNRSMDLDIPDNRSEEDFKQLGRRCIENYYKRNYPFDQGTTLGIEEKVLLEIANEPQSIKFQGYIDRLSRRDDGTVEIHDYKTGKLPSQAKVDEDRQLALYHLAVQQKWPDIDSVELVWHYIAYNEELRSRRTPEQLEQVKEEVAALVQQIEADQEFEPRKSALCSYCDYQAICPLWKHLFQVEAMPQAEKQQEPLIQLVDRYGDLKDQKKELEGEIEEVENKLSEHISDEKAETFYGTRWGVTVKRAEGISIPPKGDPKRGTIEQILKDSREWDNLSALDTSLLKKLVSQKALDSEILNALEPLLKKETTFRYSVSAISSQDQDEP